MRRTSLEGKSRTKLPQIESDEGSGSGSPVCWVHPGGRAGVWVDGSSVGGPLRAGTLSVDPGSKAVAPNPSSRPDHLYSTDESKVDEIAKRPLTLLRRLIILFANPVKVQSSENAHE